MLTVVLYAASLLFLTLATRRANIGTSYAVWAGSGAALIALAGWVYFREPVTALRAISVALIIAGVIGVNLAESPSAGGVSSMEGAPAPASPSPPARR